MLELHGEKIYLKEFSKDHLHQPEYFKWLRDLAVVGTINRIEYLMPIQFSEVEEYVDHLLKSENDCFFGIHLKGSGQFIGTQRIAQIDWRTGTADMGILIGDRSQWGKGIAKEAISISSEYAFQKLSLRRLTAGTPATNTAMIKCFERLGYRQEGLLRMQLLLEGEYTDRVLFGLLKQEFKPVHKTR